MFSALFETASCVTCKVKVKGKCKVVPDL